MQEHAGRQRHELHVFVHPHALTPAVRACMNTTPKMGQSGWALAHKLGAGALIAVGSQKAISHTHSSAAIKVGKAVNPILKSEEPKKDLSEIMKKALACVSTFFLLFFLLAFVWYLS